LFILDGFCESYPRASVPKRLALDVAEREDFTNRATAYIIAGLERAVPSLFVDIKGLYGDKDKLKAVEDIVTDMKAKLEAGEGLQQDCKSGTRHSSLLIST
jgi:peptide alpha-N-acetyltransferase